MSGLREELTDGYGQPQTYDQSWISAPRSFGAAESTTDAPSEFVSGGDDEIDITTQKNAARDVMHILAKLTDATDHDAAAPNGATATIGLWVQPEGDDGWYKVDEYTTDNESGDVWTRRHNLPGTYRVGVSDLSADTRVVVKYAVTG